MKNRRTETVEAAEINPTGADLDELYAAHQVHALAQRLLHCLMTERAPAVAPVFRPFMHWYP